MLSQACITWRFECLHHEDIATFSEGVEGVEHSTAASTRMENRAVALEAVRSHCHFHKDNQWQSTVYSLMIPSSTSQRLGVIDLLEPTSSILLPTDLITLQLMFAIERNSCVPGLQRLGWYRPNSVKRHLHVWDSPTRDSCEDFWFHCYQHDVSFQLFISASWMCNARILSSALHGAD